MLCLVAPCVGAWIEMTVKHARTSKYMGFDYMMTSQVLWGCYDTVPKLAIYEIYRPKDVDFVTLFRYRWNGKIKEYVESGADA